MMKRNKRDYGKNVGGSNRPFFRLQKMHIYNKTPETIGLGRFALWSRSASAYSAG